MSRSSTALARPAELDPEPAPAHPPRAVAAPVPFRRPDASPVVHLRTAEQWAQREAELEAFLDQESSPVA